MVAKNEDRNEGWQTIYLACIAIWSFAYTIVNESLIDVPSQLYGFVWAVIRAILLIKILASDFVRVERGCLGVGIILLGTVSAMISESSFLEPFFWFLGSANGINLQKLLKVMLCAQFLAFTLVVVLCCTGTVENYVVWRLNRARYSIGFGQPNTAAQKAMQIGLLYLCVRNEDVRFRHLVLYLLFEFVVYVITDSLTAFSISIFTVALFLLFVLSKKPRNESSRFQKVVFGSLRLVLFACVGLSAYIAISGGDAIAPFFEGSTIESRIQQSSLYFENYPITLFGQKLYYHGTGNIQSDVVSGMYTLDNAYVYLLLGFGIVIFIVLLALLAGTIRMYLRKKEYIPVILMVAYLIYGLSETGLIRFSYNFTLIFIFGYVWSRLSSRGSSASRRGKPMDAIRFPNSNKVFVSSPIIGDAPK